MLIRTFALTTALVSILAIPGCGNGVEDDPLAGSWSNTQCFGESSTPADIESCKTTITFANSLDLTVEIDWISRAATATTPGCTTTRLVTGQQWSTEQDVDTFTLTGKPAATIARSNCVNDADNADAKTTTEITIPNGDNRYSLSGDTLTIESGSLAGVYTR